MTALEQWNKTRKFLTGQRCISSYFELIFIRVQPVLIRGLIIVIKIYQIFIIVYVTNVTYFTKNFEIYGKGPSAYFLMISFLPLYMIRVLFFLSIVMILVMVSRDVPTTMESPRCVGAWEISMPCLVIIPRSFAR